MEPEIENPGYLGQVPIATQYWGEWGVLDVDGGRVGPYNTPEEAFEAAVAEAVRYGAKELPLDGFAQVADDQGEPVGPIT